MKSITIIAFLVLMIMPCIASPDSVVTGPYNISFDLGVNRSDYNISMAAPKIVETLGGDERTDYSVDIIDRKDKSRTIKIFVKKTLEAGREATADVLETALELNNAGDSRISGFKTATRTIDGAGGAIASAYNNAASVEVYLALYQPLFDPTHTLVELQSTYPWEEGTLQLLKTIHVEKINDTL